MPEPRVQDSLLPLLFEAQTENIAFLSGEQSRVGQPAQQLPPRNLMCPRGSGYQQLAANSHCSAQTCKSVLPFKRHPIL